MSYKSNLNKTFEDNKPVYGDVKTPIVPTNNLVVNTDSRYSIDGEIVELQKRGIDHGFDIKAAKEVVANKELVKKYDKISKEFDGYNLRVLKYAKDKGLITEEAFDAIVEANKNYVPFSRVMDSVAGEVGYTKNVSNPLKRIKGSQKDVIDPIETTYSNTFHIIKKIIRY